MYNYINVNIQYNIESEFRFNTPTASCEQEHQKLIK